MKFLDNLKAMASDWLKSAQSKRLVAAIVTAVFTTVGVETGWLTENQSMNIAGIVIAAILGDSYRPMNPSKLEES
tara:strand:- start:22537 stop:22761 length:225 start_codon:yes stop_codon:yes gene_type:complete